MLARSTLCSRVYDLVLAKRCVMWRSPPFSGKTSIRLLIAHWCRSSGAKFRVVTVSLMQFDVHADGGTEQTRWASDWANHARLEGQPAPPWTSLIAANCTIPTLIILDEVQRFYHRAADFPLWAAVKDTLGDGCPNLRFLLLSTFNLTHASGLGSPVQCAPMLVPSLASPRPERPPGFRLTITSRSETCSCRQRNAYTSLMLLASTIPCWHLFSAPVVSPFT